MTPDVINSLGFTPIQIRKYLTAQGWQSEPTTKQRTWFFQHPVNRYGQIYVPIDADVPSFWRSVLETIECLKEIESRTEADIIDSLLYPDSDIVRYHILSPQAARGTIALSAADQFITSVVRSLKAAVCDVVSPQLHHPRMKRKETDMFLKNAQLAETEHGSFIVKVLCPLDSIETVPQLFLENDIPVVRQVTSHLLSAAQKLVTVIEDGKQGEFIDTVRNNTVQNKISVDLCLALSQTQVWEDASMELSTRWAPVLKNKQSIPNSVKLHKSYFPRIAEIVDAIMPQPQEQKQEGFVAVVDECKGTINNNGEREGTVVLQVFTNDGEYFKAAADLPPEQYKIAADTHIGGGQHYVSIQGKLIRKSRSSEIVNITAFASILLNQ
jgi:hypothetical protein